MSIIGDRHKEIACKNCGKIIPAGSYHLRRWADNSEGVFDHRGTLEPYCDERSFAARDAYYAEQQKKDYMERVLHICYCHGRDMVKSSNKKYEYWYCSINNPEIGRRKSPTPTQPAGKEE